MSYLVDTDVVANWLKGRQEEVTLLSNFGSEDLTISLITYGEIYDGIYYGRNPQKNERIFQQFLRWVEVLPLNRSIMKQFAQIRGHLRRSGQLIGDPDLMIAATALYHDLTVVTHNFRHFRRVPDLKLYQELSSSTYSGG
jgi:predicted nucleic acid-binding protein